MTTEERVERLERELVATKQWNRRLLIGLGLAGGMFILVWSFTNAAGTAQAQEAKKAEKVIRANRFILENENGVASAVMVANKAGTALTLADENGKTRVILAAAKTATALALNDENGRTRAEMSVTKTETSLKLTDENGRTRAALAVIKDGTGLVLFDENGKVIWQTPLE